MPQSRWEGFGALSSLGKVVAGRELLCNVPNQRTHPFVYGPEAILNAGNEQ